MSCFGSYTLMWVRDVAIWYGGLGWTRLVGSLSFVIEGVADESDCL